MVIDMELKRDKNGRAIIDDELFELFTRYINQGDNRDDNTPYIKKLRVVTTVTYSLKD